MATGRPEPIIWPYEYQGWRVTFYVYKRDKNVTSRPPVRVEEEMFFAGPVIEHLHVHKKQNVRWTRKRGGIDITKPPASAMRGWERADAKEQLCCFICAEYMPEEIYNYFEKCREMTKCSMME